jgi:hypothetical protein
VGEGRDEPETAGLAGGRVDVGRLGARVVPARGAEREEPAHPVGCERRAHARVDNDECATFGNRGEEDVVPGGDTEVGEMR